MASIRNQYENAVIYSLYNTSGGSNNPGCLLLVYIFADNLARPNYKLMIGIITADFVEVEETDCRPQLHSFFSCHFTANELNTIMTSHASYVSDYFNS